MLTHTPKVLSERFLTNAEYLTLRTDLVKALIERLRKKRVIVIRAPPRVGKSTITSLIGREIIQYHLDLEPVDIKWQLREAHEIEERHYSDILQKAKRTAKERNAMMQEEMELTKHGGSTTTIFMIDDAVDTYNETEMWDQLFKNDPEGLDACYLLICVYGSSNGTHRWGRSPGQSADIPPDRRIELHPTSAEELQVLLNEREIRQLVERWADTHVPKATCDENVYKFIESETQGHVGVIARLLRDVKQAIENRVLSRYQHRSLYQLTHISEEWPGTPGQSLHCTQVTSNNGSRLFDVSVDNEGLLE